MAKCWDAEGIVEWMIRWKGWGGCGTGGKDYYACIFLPVIGVDSEGL